MLAFEKTFSSIDGYKITIQGLMQSSTLHLSREKLFMIGKNNFWYSLTTVVFEH